MRRLLDMTAGGVVDQTDRRLIPEFIIGDDIEAAADSDDDDAKLNIVVRLWYPRFVAAVVYDTPPPDHGANETPTLAPVKIHPGCWLRPLYWIDYPVGFDPLAVLMRCAAGLKAHFDEMDEEYFE